MCGEGGGGDNQGQTLTLGTDRTLLTQGQGLGCLNRQYKKKLCANFNAHIGDL